MASAANSSAAAYERSNGGAGGKFRKRPFRSTSTTPYDRPPTALRPTQINNNGWLSKIVDPASKLITAGAHRLFSTVFRKRLLPPPPSPPPQPFPEEGREKQYGDPETTANVVASAVEVQVDFRGNDGSRPSDSNGVSELEDILKHKTFTRSEIDHLTALLLARTPENLNGVEKGGSETNVSDLQAVRARHDMLSNFPAHENRIDHAISAAISTPEVRSKVFQDDVVSPAEIAKAYMGSRPTKVSPLALRLQSQVSKEEFPTPYNPWPNAISPATSLTRKPVSDVGTSSNSFMTPRFRGRSAIYSMARTPYSRHHVTALKPAETNSNIGGESSFQNGTENNQAEKQVLKRRSSVLENDIGSVGPIRRIRQKSNLLHPKTLALALPPSGGHQATQVSGMLSNVTEVPTSVEWSSQNRSFAKVSAENSMAGTSSGYVPSQSIEMAQKIFEQLDKFNPKGLLDKKADISAGNSPTKKPGMEGLDYLKPLRSRQDINGLLDSVHAHNHAPGTSSRLEEVSGKKFATPSVSLGTQDSAEGRSAVPCFSSKSKAVEHMMPLSIADRPQKKRAFQMSAHEDCPELDDDGPSDEVALSTPLTEVRQRAESPRKPVTVPDILPWDQTITVEKPPETKKSEQLAEKEELEFVANGFPASETAASFPTSLASSSSLATNRAIVGAISAAHSILTSDNIAPQSEIRTTSTAFSPKSDNVPPIFHTSPADGELGTPISSNRVVAEVNGPPKTDNGSTQVFGNAVIRSGDPLFVGALPSKALTNYSVPANGSASTVVSTADGSCPVLFTSIISKSQSSTPASISSSSSASSLNLSSCGAQPAFTPPTSVAGISNTSGLPGSVAAGSLTFASAFPLASEGLATSASESTDVCPGNPSSSRVERKPSAFGLAENTISDAFRSTGNDVQTAGPAGNSRPTFAFQTGSTPGPAFASSFPGKSVSSVSAPASTSAPSFPGQSSSSVSTPALTTALSFPGQSASSVSAPASTSAMSSPGPSAASSSAFVFGSSVPSGSSFVGSISANPFSTAASAAGSSLTISSVSASSPTSNIFGNASQTSKPTTIDAPASQSPPFSFGLPSSGASTSSPGVFGVASSSVASSGPTFVFGATPVPASKPAFPSTPSNCDQTTMEDSMAEDSLQPSPAAPAFGVVFGASAPTPTFGTSAPTPAFGASAPTPAFGASAPTPAFGASISTPSSGFVFNPAAPAGSPFQFNTQQGSTAPQNPSFQPTGSIEFNGGTNSFSLGTNDQSLGNDRSQRKIFRAKRGPKRK